MKTAARSRRVRNRSFGKTWSVLARAKSKAPPWAVSLLLHALILAWLSLVVLKDRHEGALSIDTRWSSSADSEFEFTSLSDDLQSESLASDLPESLSPQELSVPEVEPLSLLDPATFSSENPDFSSRVPVAISPVSLDLSGNSLAGRSAGRKEELLRRFGGSELTEKAVALGLRWIARHQADDGNWSLNFQPNCRRRPCTEPGRMQSDTAATGLALLSFLGAGHSLQSGKYQKNVRHGIEWLISQQQHDGDLSPAGTKMAHMYAHGIAAIALCEAYIITDDSQLRDPAQRAIDFIVATQHESLGGWRYVPRQDSDTSVFGWQLMALESGRIAGLEVPETTLQAAERWLDSVASEDGSRYAYQPGRRTTFAMTAEGLLCRQYLGWPREHPALVAGAELLMLKENLPNRRQRNVYAWYYATQVMYHLQGDGWQTWNQAITQTLLKTQVTRGSMVGSWHVSSPTRDAWGGPGGRLYVTALSLLILEVYYRHLPLYRELGK